MHEDLDPAIKSHLSPASILRGLAHQLLTHSPLPLQVKYLFGWTDDINHIEGEQLCHPLCQCDECMLLRRVSGPSSTTSPLENYLLHLLLSFPHVCIHTYRQTTVLGSSLTVNTCDGQGHTLIHRAAQHGKRKIVELLLSHGADINPKTKDFLTPLHLACQYNHKDVRSVAGGVEGEGRREER